MRIAASAIALAWLSILPARTSADQTQTPADFHAEVMHTYDFAPHTLTKEQRNAKNDAMDAFWGNAKANHDTYVAGLRRELTNFDNPPFFLFDGSELLLSLSSTPDDQKIVLAAMPHTDLRDVDPTPYLILVHHLAGQDDDTTAAAFHVFTDPAFKAYIVQHALTLRQDYSLVFMLYPTDQKFWLDAAIARLDTEKDETALKSLLLVVWYAQTDESDAAVKKFAADASKPQASRTAAQKFLDLGNTVPAAKSADTSPAALDALRARRRERMEALSDEALDDFEDYTRQIVAIRKARAGQIT